MLVPRGSFPERPSCFTSSRFSLRGYIMDSRFYKDITNRYALTSFLDNVNNIRGTLYSAGWTFEVCMASFQGQ